MPEGSPPSGSRPPARGIFSRPPISLALVGLVTLLTAGTGATLGALAWREKHAGSRALVDSAMTQAARMTADHAAAFVRYAESTVRLGPSLVARGLLDPNDFRALGEYALGVLRANPQLAWVSYGDRADRFVGAWTDGSDQFYVNRSFPRGGRIRLEEDRVLPDGRRERVRESDDHRYRPREQAFYRLAEARRGVAWTEPYRFYDGGLGVTCATPLLDGAGAARGVFTVDLSLDGLSRFVGRAPRVAPGSGLHRHGRRAASSPLRAASTRPGMTTSEDAALVGEVVKEFRASVATGYSFQRGGRALPRAGGRLSDRRPPVDLGGRGARARLHGGHRGADVAGRGARGSWRWSSPRPEASSLVRWIAQPLRELGAQARRIREGDLDVAIVPRSRDEIGALARTMAEMVQGLRDRDFIRDVLGRYVSQELAEQCVRDRGALRLGGEVRTVSILMSDLRGFSGLSERLGPEKMIALLNRYLGAMTPVILGHRGTINEFIGDAILVLFGAPFERPDDAERAVRCAWAMQRAMSGFNAESAAQGLPPLVMGIAVHSGAVVAGNIGSQDRMKYGVVGPTVNLTGRIESLTIGPQILLSEATLGRVRHVVSVGPGIQVAVKGVPEPVTVYELTGVTGEAGIDAPDDQGGLAEVDLPAVALVVGEGKRIDETPPSGPSDAHRPRDRGVRRERRAALPMPHSDLQADRRFRRRRGDRRELRPRRRSRALGSARAARHADPGRVHVPR